MPVLPVPPGRLLACPSYPSNATISVKDEWGPACPTRVTAEDMGSGPACNSGRPHIIGIQGRPPELVPQAHGGPRHDDQAHARHQSQLRAGPPADRLEVLGGRPALERYALHTREAWQVHPLRSRSHH